jgi:amidase
MNTLTRIASVAVATMWVLHLPRGYAQSEATSTPFEIMETSIDEVLAAFRADKLTAHQLVQRYLDRIDAYDKRGPTINSVIAINPEALAEADRLDAAYKASGPVGPLHGIPILIKDEIDTAGMPTTLGTVVFKDYRPLTGRLHDR